jgi:hypothetical protein
MITSILFLIFFAFTWTTLTTFAQCLYGISFLYGIYPFILLILLLFGYGKRMTNTKLIDGASVDNQRCL